MIIGVILVAVGSFGLGHTLGEYKKRSLERFLRDRVDEMERYQEYSVATDTIRAWIDVFNN